MTDSTIAALIEAWSKYEKGNYLISLSTLAANAMPAIVAREEVLARWRDLAHTYDAERMRFRDENERLRADLAQANADYEKLSEDATLINSECDSRGVRLAKLEAELAAKTKSHAHYVELVGMYIVQMAELAECRKDKVDAERYRICRRRLGLYALPVMKDLGDKHAKEFDETADAALAQQKARPAIGADDTMSLEAFIAAAEEEAQQKGKEEST